jgi:hypothetical protein
MTPHTRFLTVPERALVHRALRTAGFMTVLHLVNDSGLPIKAVYDATGNLVLAKFR